MSSHELLELAMPDWAKKHGYIIWGSKRNEEIHHFFGEEVKVELQIKGKILKTRTIEYQYRRLGIGYALTRSLPEGISKVVLTKTKGKLIEVEFK